MTDKELRGFKCYLANQLAVLGTSADVYWENPRRDKENSDDQAKYRKLRFKSKIHRVFAREIDQEILFRRELARLEAA